jgi:hypothetical protein
MIKLCQIVSSRPGTTPTHKVSKQGSGILPKSLLKIAFVYTLISLIMNVINAKSHPVSFEHYQKLVNPHDMAYLVNGNVDEVGLQAERYQKLVNEDHASGVLQSYADKIVRYRGNHDLKTANARNYDKNQSHTLATQKPQLHSERIMAERERMEQNKPIEPHFVGYYEKELMNEIQEKPIALIGEPTLINYCPHDCNNQGLCQRIYIKTFDEETNKEVYEPHYSCACRDNFKGHYCHECTHGFFGQD